ncbi:tetratricopeptide repeat protein 31 isoform X1 [Alosa sapidissima]|uniref:tetratricopeptide repeat protein 31 isoform X1 n=1 Tax=Alosa sapidissima TaxID=34773 RepID=UPI001C0A555E|nr:tetratricopeptide repeat protein 31 isoform X1 [Alosa sapidissima]
MRFTRDIYRLLGLSSGPSEQREESMETEAATDASHTSAPQEPLSGEEGLSEEERSKRRAEKRRAKKKRQKERKKLEKGKQNENMEQEEESAEGPGESESEEEGPGGEQEEEGPAQEEEEPMKEVEPAPVPPPTKSSVAPPLGSRANRQHATSEEDPEWDVSSAFVANAVSHLRPRAKSKTPRSSRENKENESRGGQTNCTDSGAKRSAYLTEKGIQLVQEGQYFQAVSMFTEAIKYDATNYRFFGNRSYCYECLELYPQALADAEMSIRLAPTWPKGFYRQGSALMGLKRYSEAEKAMEQVLLLDKDCEEAANELFNCRALQLMDLGFEEMQSVSLLEKYTTVQAALASSEATAVVTQESSSGQAGGPSLWVGNVTTELTEKHLWDLFKTCGEIDSIRVLHERFCAFVNFKNASMASRALEKLNGYGIENTRLVVRYPDRRTQRPLPLLPLKAPPPLSGASGARRRGPVHGDECYFWRTTGCHFGEKCRYKHIPDQRGKDRKPWQP